MEVLQLTPGETVEVAVSHVESPQSFYVQRVLDEGKLKSLMDGMRELYENPKTASSFPPLTHQEISSASTLIAVKEHESGAWSRGKVISPLSDTFSFTVLYVDYGPTEEVKDPCVTRRLDERFLRDPAMGIHCSLDLPSEGRIRRVAEFRAKLGGGKKLIMMASCSGIKPDGVAVVELTDQAPINPVPTIWPRLSNRTPTTDYSDSGSGPLPPVSAPPCRISRRQTFAASSFTPDSLYPGQEMEVRLVTVTDPDSFCLVLESKWADLHRLTTELKDFFSGMEETEARIKGGLYDKKPCAALVDWSNGERIWARAMILTPGSTSSEQPVKVMFVDYGREEYINTDELRMLDRAHFLKEGPLGINCFLNFDPLERVKGMRDGRWSEETVEWMNRHLMDGTLLASFLDYDHASQRFAVWLQMRWDKKTELDKGDGVDEFRDVGKEILRIQERRGGFPRRSSVPSRDERVVVALTGFHSPHFFSVHLKSEKAILEEMNRECAKRAEHGEVLNLESGTVPCPCLAFSERGWAGRAEILSLNKEGIFSVLFVDYGIVENCDQNSLCHLPAESELIRTTQALAIPCSLEEESSEPGRNDLGSQIKHNVANFLMESECCFVDGERGDGRWRVEIRQCGKDVREGVGALFGIVDTHLSSPNINFEKKFMFLTEGTYTILGLPSLTLAEFNKSFGGIPCYCQKPEELYLQLTDNSDSIRAFSKKLQDMMRAKKDLSRIQSPRKNELCVALFSEDEHWYRAIVLDSINLSSKLRVFFVDYGNCGEVELRNVCRMPEETETSPPLAFPCSLRGVHCRPSGHILKLLESGELIATIKSVSDERYEVDVRVQTDKELVIINSLLSDDWLTKRDSSNVSPGDNKDTSPSTASSNEESTKGPLSVQEFDYRVGGLGGVKYHHQTQSRGRSEKKRGGKRGGGGQRNRHTNTSSPSRATPTGTLPTLNKGTQFAPSKEPGNMESGKVDEKSKEPDSSKSEIPKVEKVDSEHKEEGDEIAEVGEQEESQDKADTVRTTGDTQEEGGVRPPEPQPSKEEVKCHVSAPVQSKKEVVCIEIKHCPERIPCVLTMPLDTKGTFSVRPVPWISLYEGMQKELREMRETGGLVRMRMKEGETESVEPGGRYLMPESDSIMHRVTLGKKTRKGSHTSTCTVILDDEGNTSKTDLVYKLPSCVEKTYRCFRADCKLAEAKPAVDTPWPYAAKEFLRKNAVIRREKGEDVEEVMMVEFLDFYCKKRQGTERIHRVRIWDADSASVGAALLGFKGMVPDLGPEIRRWKEDKKKESGTPVKLLTASKGGDDLWVSVMKSGAIIGLLMDEIQRELTPSHRLQPLSLGQFCVAKQGRDYRRGKILEVKGEMVEIFCVDYGSVVQVPAESVYRIQLKWAEHEGHAVHCQLKKDSGAREWPEESRECLKSLAEAEDSGINWIMTVVNDDDTEKLTVELKRASDGMGLDEILLCPGQGKKETK